MELWISWLWLTVFAGRIKGHMLMFGLNGTVDKLAMANSVRW